jgi:transposase
MSDAMLDAGPEGDWYRRIEVITGRRRRRRRTAQEKARIVAESFEEGATSPKSHAAMALSAGC